MINVVVNMLWLLLAILCAISYTALHIAGKKFVKRCDAAYLAYARVIIGALISIPLIFLLKDFLQINKTFLLWLIPVGMTTGTAQIFYMMALKRGKISKTVPLLTLSPMLTIPFAYLFVKELPAIIGISGVALIVLGTYILNLENIRKNPFGPFKAVYANIGARFMLFVALIYGIGSAIDKAVINTTNPITYLLIGVYSTLIVQTTILSIKDKKRFFKNTKKIFKENLKGAIILSIIAIIVLAFQFYAVSMTYAAYVIAIKRTAAVFTVMAGFFIFKERKHFLTTLIGAIVMVVGTFLLVI